MTVKRPNLEAIVAERRQAGELLGFSVDESEGTVTFFVPADETVSGYPESVDDLTVLLAPLPRARAIHVG